MLAAVAVLDEELLGVDCLLAVLALPELLLFVSFAVGHETFSPRASQTRDQPQAGPSVTHTLGL